MINSYDPEISWVVMGLSAPTDFALDDSGRLYVLELCDDLLDPVSDYDALRTHVGHGGFRRFSGRLLLIAPDTSAVVVITQGLDTPTNLTLAGNRAYGAQGMGTPGRQIPYRDGTVVIDGFIEVVELPD